MGVRGRLVTGFVTVALFVLALFGFVAHRSASYVNNTQELAFLQQVVDTHAETLAGHFKEEDSAQALLDYLPDERFGDSIFAILDGNNGVITRTIHRDEVAALLNRPEYYKESSAKHRLTMWFGQQEEVLTWVTAPLEGSPYTLLLIYRADAGLPTFSSALAKRLGVTAFIIIWLAIWVALIVSKRIVKRLDEQNAALLHQAWYDSLTDLPNRYHLNKNIDEHIVDGKRFSLLVVDLNNLRDVNDALGHDAGDTLIREASKRMVKVTARAGLVARLGGDSFAVIADESSLEDVKKCSQGIIDVLATPIIIKGLELVTHPSIGAAQYPQHADDANALINCAEIAMYRAKQERKAFQSYSEDIDPYSIRHLALMSDLTKALDEHQVINYYQPKIDLSTLQTTSVETLARWLHPEQGLIPPDEFIGLAEKSELINKLTLGVLEDSIKQCRSWMAGGYSLGVAVNLSARNLYDSQLLPYIQNCLDRWEVPPQQLKLEITESILMSDPETALRTLHQLNEMGIALSIDDFGTGYSSLSYLKQLPVSEIKIDRSFVKDMMVDENDAFIVRSTIDLAHNLGCTVVAEGIENLDTLMRLKELGCDYGQGFLISRPCPAEQLENWLVDSQWPAKKLAS